VATAQTTSSKNGHKSMTTKRRKPANRPTLTQSKIPTPSAETPAIMNVGAIVGTVQEIRIFLSYAHADDESLGMIQPFKDLLSRFIQLKSGLTVKSFLDQNDIKWGELWRDRLDEEILASTVFIPILSTSYLASENCRSEFLQFRARSTILGVPQLLLPVLLVNAPDVFQPNSTDEIVQVVTNTQWEVIEDAVLSEPGSSAWKQTMMRLSERFVSAYRKAEASLAELPESPTESSPFPSDPPEQKTKEGTADKTNTDAPGLVELTQQLTGTNTEMTEAMDSLNNALTQLAQVGASVPSVSPSSNIKQFQAWSFTTAQRLKPVALLIGSSGERLFSAVRNFDRDIRSMHALSLSLPEDWKTSLKFSEMFTKMEDLSESRKQLVQLIAEFTPLEQLSVPIRKAISPMKQGLVRCVDSIGILEELRDDFADDKPVCESDELL